MKRHLLLAFTLLLSGMSLAQAMEKHLTSEGRTLVANLELAAGKSLSDGVVLMTHGTLAHGRMEIMASLQTMLKERGINSLSITLGLDKDKRHGMFDCGEIHTHKHSDAMKEIGLWLDWLKRQGAGPVTLLGHSRGGNQTAWYASEHPEAGFERVVLIAPATWNYQHVKQDYETRYKQALDENLSRARKLLEQGKGDTLMKNVGFIYCPDATVRADSFVDYYRDDIRRNTPSVLNKITKPVMVFAGSEDTVVTDLIEPVTKLADDEHIKLVVIDGADHFFRDLYAEELADHIADFMGA